MSTVTIEVDERDIEQGEPQSNFLCPIALATDRALRALLDNRRLSVSVGGDEIEVWIEDDGGSPDFSVQMPDNAKGFVAAFDEDDDPDKYAPFQFGLEVPDGLVVAR